MTTEKEYKNEIINITMKIYQEYPELSTFLEEMPDTISNYEPDTINLKYMKEYYNSLVALMATYSKTHESTK